jgi:hypothetical protein
MENREFQRPPLSNRRARLDIRLNFAGIDSFAARDNHILQSVQDVEISRGIKIADISCGL